MAVPKGFWLGASKYFDDRETKRLSAEQFLAEQLTKTKEFVLPEIIKRLDRQRTKRQERDLRISQAELLQFSRRTAVALEKSGQLEMQLARIAELEKKGQLDADYIIMLDTYVSTKIDNDEDLAAAISQGLNNDSFVTEDQQMEGLLLAMHTTDEEDFSKAVEMLQTTPNPNTKVSPFDIGITKGRVVDSDDRRKIHNELGRKLASNLNTRLIQSVRTDDGEFVQFEDPQVSSFLSEMVDNIVKYELDIGTQLSRRTLINEAEDLIEVLPRALVPSGNSFGSPEYGLPWAQKNFAEVFKSKMLSPDVDEFMLWQPYITPRVAPSNSPGDPSLEEPNLLLPPSITN